MERKFQIELIKGEIQGTLEGLVNVKEDEN